MRPALKFGTPRRVLAAALVAWAATQAGAAEPDPDPRYEAARAEYDNGHYRQAFEGFARLADGGHCQAARTARQMLRFGPGLYGLVFSVPPERLAQWPRPAACEAQEARPR